MLKPIGIHARCGVCDVELPRFHVLACAQCKEPVCSGHARIVDGAEVARGQHLADVVCSVCFAPAGVGMAVVEG